MRVLFPMPKDAPDASLMRLLTADGWDVERCATDEVGARGAHVDVVIAPGTPLDAATIEAGGFGLIQQSGVGLDKIDVDAATRAGVWVSRIPSTVSGSDGAVAEIAVLFVLALNRNLEPARAALADGKPDRHISSSLAGKSACIVGFGGIGRAIAVRLRAFGMHVSAVDSKPDRTLPPDVADVPMRPMSELRDALAAADNVVLAIDYNTSMKNMFDASLLAAIKRGAYLVNIARGGLIDPDALTAALRSGALAGAGLDVFWHEPVDPHHPVFTQNVIATPHVAGLTDLTEAGSNDAVRANLARYQRGEQPRYLANDVSNVRR